MANNFPNLRPSFSADFVNGIYVDPRITFSRAGTRTYFGREVVKAEENLLQFSQEFDDAYWTKTNATVTANTTIAPDGTTTADTVTSGSAAFSAITRSVTTVAATHVFSVFAKQGSDRYIQLYDNVSSNNFAVFDLQDGVVTQAGANYTGSVVAAANGFFRCIVSFTSTAASRGFRVAFTDNNATPGYSPTPTNTGLTTILWGAQLEQRSSVTAYTPTTTQPITRYQRQLKTAAANEWPREFDPVTGECLGRSVWESRTNLLTYSENFADSSKFKSNASIVGNQIIAPDGTLTADKLVENTSNNLHFTSSSFTATAVAHSYTVFAKAAERSWISINLIVSGGGFRHAYFDLANGAIGTVNGDYTSASITPAGNGWYRCRVTRTATAATWTAIVITSTGDGVSSYAGDGVSGVYIWGEGAEAGAFATPYIPTVASQVTRLADSAVMTGVNFSSWFNPEQGAFVYDAADAVIGDATNNRHTVFEASDGTLNNRISAGKSAGGGTANFVYANVVAGGTEQAYFAPTGAITANTYYKFSASYKLNEITASLAGGAVGSDTTAVIPVVDRLTVGRRSVGTNPFNGYIKRLTYYPQAFTAANHQAITR